MSNQTKGLAALLAAHGRNGDTELVHVNKRELAALEQIGNRNGIHTTTNPHTGLKEAFNWASTLGAVAGGIGGTFAAPFTGGVINPYTGAALGSAAGTKLSGGSNEEALMNGVISGVTAWGIGGATDALAEAGKTGVQEGVKTGVQEGTQQLATQNLTDAATQNLAQTSAPNMFSGVNQSGLSNVYNPSAAGSSLIPPTTPIPGGSLANFQAGAPTTDGGITGSFVSKTTPVTLSSGETLSIPNSVVQGTGTTAPANTLSASGTTPEYWSNVKGGIKSLDTPGKAGEFAVANKGSLMAAGIGGYGMATDAAAQPENTGTGEEAVATNPSYRGEVYYTPYGERRTRAVPLARGGEVYGDYDGVDEAPDGGYRPGGGLNYAGGGGIGFIDSMQPGGKWGDVTTDAFMAVDKNNPQWLKDMQPGGFIGATQPGYLGAQRRKEDEERAKQEQAAGIAAAAKAREAEAYKQKWDDRYSQGFAEGGEAFYISPHQVGNYRGEAYKDDSGTVRTRAVDVTPQPAQGLEGLGALFGGLFGARKRERDEDAMANSILASFAEKKMAHGGLSDLGHYSDGGQLLRGSGDGVSDSIPASIEGKRPARLADGEFVIPARAVSELGNGSTEAGSKQLYAMLERIAKKRKSGKGLAYQANPKKILPA